MERMMYFCALALLCSRLSVEGARIDSAKVLGTIEADEESDLNASSSVKLCDGREFYVSISAFAMSQCSRAIWRKDSFTFDAQIDGQLFHLGHGVNLLQGVPLGSFRVSQPLCDKACKGDSCNFKVQLRVIQHVDAWADRFGWGPLSCGGWSDEVTVNVPLGGSEKAEWEPLSGSAAHMKRWKFPYRHASLEFRSMDAAPMKANVPDFHVVGARPQQTAEVYAEDNSTIVPASTSATALDVIVPGVSERCELCAESLCSLTFLATTPKTLNAAITHVCETQGCKAECPQDSESWKPCRGVIANCEPDAISALKAQQEPKIREALTAMVEEERSPFKAMEEAALKECAYFRTQASCGIKQKWNTKTGKYDPIKTVSRRQKKKCVDDCTGKDLGEEANKYFRCSLQMDKPTSGDMGFVVQGNSTNCKLHPQFWLDAKMKGTLTPECEHRWSYCDPHGQDASMPACPPPTIGLDGKSRSSYMFMRGVSCIAQRKD